MNRYSYLPFGETKTVSASRANPFTFVGQGGVIQEAGGLSYMRLRYYNPTTAQFLSNDPAGFGGKDTNFRRYVGNSPNDFIDPTGSETVTVFVNPNGAVAGLGHAALSVTDGAGQTYVLNKGPAPREGTGPGTGKDAQLDIPPLALLGQPFQNGAKYVPALLVNVYPAKYTFDVSPEAAQWIKQSILQMSDPAKGGSYTLYDNCATACADALRAGGYYVPDFVFSPGAIDA